jgi:hypothetical protein
MLKVAILIARGYGITGPTETRSPERYRARARGPEVGRLLTTTNGIGRSSAARIVAEVGAQAVPAIGRPGVPG